MSPGKNEALEALKAQLAPGETAVRVSPARRSSSSAFERLRAEREKPLDWWDAVQEWWDRPTKSAPFVGTGTAIADDAKLFTAANAMADGRATPKQKALVYSYMDHARRGKTPGYYAVNLAAEVPAFIGEIYATFGVYTAGSRVGKAAARLALGKMIGKGLERAIAEGGAKKLLALGARRGAGFAGGVAAGAARQAVAVPLRVVESTILEALPDMEWTEGELGGAAIAISDKTDTFLEWLGAGFRGFMRTWAELASERTGGALAKIPPLPQLHKLQAKLLERYANDTGKTIAQAVAKLSKKTGWHGIAEEWGEERVSAALNAVFVGDDFADIFPDRNQALGEVLGFALVGTGHAALARALSMPDAPAPASQGATRATALAPLEAAPEAADLLDRMGRIQPKAIKLWQVQPDEELERDAEWAKQLGVEEVVWFDTDDSAALKYPAVSEEGRIAVYAGGASSTRRRSLLYHELVHAIEERAPGRWTELVDRFREIAPQQLEDAATRYELEEGRTLTDKERTSEAPARLVEQLGEYIEALLENPAELTRLQKRDAGLLANIVDAVTSLARRAGVQVPDRAESRPLQAARVFQATLAAAAEDLGAQRAAQALLPATEAPTPDVPAAPAPAASTEPPRPPEKPAAAAPPSSPEPQPAPAPVEGTQQRDTAEVPAEPARAAQEPAEAASEPAKPQEGAEKRGARPKKSKKARAAKPKAEPKPSPKRRVVGKNREGQTVLEDERGIRSVQKELDDGRVAIDTESVRLGPDGQPKAPLNQRRAPRYQTEEELADDEAPAAAPEPTPPPAEEAGEQPPPEAEVEPTMEVEPDGQPVPSPVPVGPDEPSTEAPLEPPRERRARADAARRRREGAGAPAGADGADGGTQPAAGELPGEGEAADGGQPDSARSGDGATDRGDPERARAVRNYRITDADGLGAGGAKTKARQNLAAIRLLKQIRREARPATVEEQSVLVKYVGWGSSELAQGMFPVGEPKAGWEKLSAELRELLTDEEWSGARGSTINAHYTSQEVVEQIWRGVERLGFTGGKVIEPGMGTGNFLGLMPAGLSKRSSYVGIELDPITAGIAELLYPEAQVRNESYGTFRAPADYFDLAIGNPPFARFTVEEDPEYRKHKLSLHDFFFAKTIDRLKPGGLMVFITSHYTMDKAGDAARTYLGERADLLGAIRLPQTAFKANAGTEVVTDVLFFRKRLPGEAPAGEPFLNTATLELETDKGVKREFGINEYFAANKSMILGTQAAAGTMYSKAEYTVLPKKSVPIAKDFARAVDNLPERVVSAPRTEGTDERRASGLRFAPEQYVEGAYFLDGKKLMVKEDGQAVPVLPRKKGVKGGLPSTHIKIVKQLVGVRDAVRAVLHAQVQDLDHTAAQAELNRVYDAFVEKNGPINLTNLSYSIRTDKEGNEKEGNEKEVVTRRMPNLTPFLLDPDAWLVAALEKYNEETKEATKAAIFTKKVISAEAIPQIEGATDALNVVLDQFGRVDVEEIAKILERDVDDVTAELAGAIFLNPRGETWETADEYLSGNVRQKLVEARAAAALDPRFAPNVDALEERQPLDLTPSQISSRLGAPWIEAQDVQKFAREALDLPTATVNHIESKGLWAVNLSYQDARSVAATVTWGTERMNAGTLLNRLLSSAEIKLHKTVYEDGKEKTVVDKDATAAAQLKATELAQAFANWIYQDGERAERIAAVYNRDFNNTRTRDFDGSHLTFPGFTDTMEPRSHQARVAWRIIQTGNTYMAHSVGAGKTMAMIMAGMEMRRLGIVNKPAYVVPNHMLAQFSREFLETYPGAQIMVADEKQFHTDRRRAFVAKIATGDYDGIVITHSAFERIGVSPEFQAKFVERELAEYRELLEQIDKGDRVNRKSVENRVKALAQQLAKLTDQESKDRGVLFEDTGIDFLFVDEAQAFRKLRFATKMGNVKGVDAKGSDRSMDLYLKLRYLESRNPGRSCCLASGTPITNTLAEAYTISRYLQLEQLEARGIHNFDAWASAFGAETADIEITAGGKWKPVTRFVEFFNLPELGQMMREVMDVVKVSDLDYIVRPEISTPPRAVVAVDKPDSLVEYDEVLKARVAAIERRRGQPQKGDDIILTVLGDGTKAAVDMRLIDETLPNDPDSKLNVAIREIFDTWEQTKADRSTQMLFSDMGVPGGSSPFNLYEWVRSELVRMGIPREEVAFIHEYPKHSDRYRLYAAMNSGKIRVLIGSTEKMGTGVNAQRRLVRLHHIDAPYVPADLEQREGRIHRQGNLNKLIDITAYVTKGSLDAHRWGLLERKQRFIDAFLAGDQELRSMEDLDGQANDMGAAKALASGDPRIIELAGLGIEIGRQEVQRKAHFDQNVAKRARIQRARKEIEYYEDRIARKKAIKIPEELEWIFEGRKEKKRAVWGKNVITRAVGYMHEARKTKEGFEHVVGTVGGVEVFLGSTWQLKDEVQLGVRANGIDLTKTIAPAESSPVGLPAQIDHMLDQLISTSYEEEQLKDAERMLRQAGAEREGPLPEDKPWPLEDEHSENVLRYEQLRAEIQKDEDAVDKAADDAPEARYAVQATQPWQARRRVDEAIASLDAWHAERDISVADANRRAVLHENRLLELVGAPRAGRIGGDFLQSFRRLSKEQQARFNEINQAIHLFVDLQQAELSGFGTPAEQLAKFGAELTPEQLALYKRSQALTAEEREIADELVAQNKAIAIQAKKDDTLRSYLESYSARLWKKREDEPAPGPPAEAIGRYTLWTGRQRQRTYQSILEGWSLGRELAIKGYIDAQRIASQQIAQVTADRRFLRAAMRENVIAKVKKQSDGTDWVRLEHPAFSAWRWVGEAVEGEAYSKDLHIDEDGQIFERVDLYGRPDLATHLNNVLGKSALRGKPVVDWLTELNAFFKKTILFTSLFHHQAFLRSFLFGSPFVRDATAWSPAKAYEAGRRAVLEFDTELQELIRAGLTLDRIQDFEELRWQEHERISAVLDRVPMVAGARAWLDRALEGQTAYLFHRLGPYLKVQSALLEFRHLQLKHPDTPRTELARIAARVANDDFGGLHLERMGRSPTVQHIFRLLALAPDWTESNVRSMVAAFKPGVEGETYRALWGRVLAKAGVATVLFNMILAAFDDDDFWERYSRSWEEGRLRWLEIDVTPLYRALGGVPERTKYFSLLGHFRDPLKFVFNPVRSAKHKASALSGMVLEALEGTDWAGRQFTTWAELIGVDDKGVYRSTVKGKHRAGEPKGGRLAGQTVAWRFATHGAISWDQLPSFMVNQVRGLMPIQVQNGAAWLAGEIDAWDALTKSLGLMTATSYLEARGTELEELDDDIRLMGIMIRDARRAGEHDRVPALVEEKRALEARRREARRAE